MFARDRRYLTDSLFGWLIRSTSLVVGLLILGMFAQMLLVVWPMFNAPSVSEQAFVAGKRFTIADITAFCTIEFSRLMKFKPAEAGYPHIQAWRDRVAQRASASAGDN